MAMSLEELLAAEGFKRGRSNMMPRASYGLESISMPLYPVNDRCKHGSSSGVRKTEKTKSDISHYYSIGEFLTHDKVKGKKPRDNLVRQDNQSKKEEGMKHERRGSQEVMHVKKVSTGSSEDLAGSKIISIAQSNEIVEVGPKKNVKYIDTHSYEAYSPEQNEAQPLEKHKRVYKKHGYSSKKKLPVYKNRETTQKSTKSHETSSDRTNGGSPNSSNLDEGKSQRRANKEHRITTPALDELAVQAMISILCGYIKCFIRDENFRASHRHNSFASLNVVGAQEGFRTDGKVVVHLKEAIETIERAIEECASAKELKKASLQLNVITGLNSDDLKDGFTSGISNFKLSACAHFYLSVIYKLQKKDRAAAKHLLQVFCDSPFQARTALLPDLWEKIFFPHLSDLKVWYSDEASSLVNSPSKTRKLKFLEKVYNEIMDSGTYQFAVYYKDWLTEGDEAPLLPSIQIPSISVQFVQQAGLDNQSPDADSPVTTFIPHPMVNKTVYDAVFRHSAKPGYEVAWCKEEGFDISARSSHDAAVDENSSVEIVKHTELDVKSDADSHQNSTVRVVGAQRSYGERSPGRANLNEKFGNHETRQETSDRIHKYHAPPAPDSKQIILSTLAKAVFELQQPENSIYDAATLLPYRRDVLHHDCLVTHSWSAVEELQENCGYLIGGTFCLSIPQDFICPLTEMLFEDPVTLETGQTFERSAITNWFGKGNRTCPVTRKTLEYQAVPLTNFILKRVINDWKSEHFRNLMDLTSQLRENVASNDEIAVFILEQLLAGSSPEERIRSGRQLISLGGLQFLIRRFQCGNLKEKTRVSSLLLNCILAEPSYRDQVARNIDKLSLLELLHCRQLRSKTNAVLLLTQLICLNRRKDAKYFLDGLQNEERMSALRLLLMYLQSCLCEDRPLVAVLLLHLDLLVEPQEYSVHRQVAVDAITLALESSLSDEKVREKCCKALLILGGHFSFAGKIMTEDWILKQAGFLDGPVFDSPENEENIFIDESIPMLNQHLEDVDEGNAQEKWLANLSASLLGDGSKSFLEVTARCLVSENPDFVRVCLTTVAWLSSALASLSEAEFQLSAFSALISGLKGCLENGELVEHKILASMSLLNFSKFPECRLLLMTMADDIASHLENLAEVTWTAKELYSTICSE